MRISKIKPLTSQYHSVGGSRGRGLLCLAPQLVLSYFVIEKIKSAFNVCTNFVLRKQHVACTAQAASDLIDMVVPVSHLLCLRRHLDVGYVWHKAAFSTGMTKYRVDRILPARTRDRSRNGRVDRLITTSRPWHNDYDVLITAPNDRVDRILAAED